MRKAGEWRKNIGRFIVRNQRLLWLLGLLLGGVEIGCLLFRAAWRPLAETLRPLLAPTAPVPGLTWLLHHTISSCAPTALLLLVLFAAGLSVCGVPVAFAVPIFFGMGLGLSEAYYFSTGYGGLGYVALLVLPHTLLAGIALLVACAESMRMSSLLCRQMLPRQSCCGGLWPSFKLYLARYLLCFCLLFASGAVDTLLQRLFAVYFL